MQSIQGAIQASMIYYQLQATGPLRITSGPGPAFIKGFGQRTSLTACPPLETADQCYAERTDAYIRCMLGRTAPTSLYQEVRLEFHQLSTVSFCGHPPVVSLPGKIPYPGID